METSALEDEALPFRKQALAEWIRNAHAIASDAETTEDEDGPGVVSGAARDSIASAVFLTGDLQAADSRPHDYSQPGTDGDERTVSGHGTDTTRGSNGQQTASRTFFWDIPTEDLVLDHLVAAGSAGNVWRATYRDHGVVAAKQLTALSDFGTPAHAAVTELVNEVAILGENRNDFGCISRPPPPDTHTHLLLL